MKPFFLFIAAALSLAGAVLFADEFAQVAGPDISADSSNYPTNRAPLSPSIFMKLPVGAVTPSGWLGRYMELQRDGLTGKLGKLSIWLEKNDNAWLSKGGSHGWEEVPYWLRGYADLAYILKDREMIAEAQIWIDAIIENQSPSGYFGPVDGAGNPPQDLWPNMLVLFLMRSYYEFSHDERVIPFLTRYFMWVKDLPEEKFLKTYWENTRAGDMLLICFWLYNITGNDDLISVAEKIKRNAADWEGDSYLPNWHNVNIAQSFRLPAEWSLCSKNEADVKASYNDFWLIRAVCGQVPGGMFGGDENTRLGYIDPRQGIETCAIFEQMTSDMIMLRITGDSFWADQCEDVAFNTAPAAVMPDFKALRYITSPNQTVSDHLNHNPGINNGGPMMTMNPFSSRCCQHNHSHGWPYYVENLWMATPDGGLAAVLYGANSVTAKVADGREVTIAEETRYPFDEKIDFTVQVAEPTTFPLYFRIPKWAKKMSLSLNGEVLGVAADDTLPDFGRVFESNEAGVRGDTWFKVVRSWKRGDRVSLSVPMSFQWRRWQQNKNSVSLNYGPLTFSLKIKERYEQILGTSEGVAMGDSSWQEGADPAEWPAFDILPDSDWNYGLINPDSVDPEELSLQRRPWPADQFPWSVDAVPCSVKLKAKKIPGWQIDRYRLTAPLPLNPASEEPIEEVEMIPMGAARLRLSALPTLRE
ncbi:MAG: glycoside hydrolase family 127 protein [Thermoguttaceae bacterium]|nr:glycoside hydrolase family 127 protein [Thermoguttaceae bacterium]